MRGIFARRVVSKKFPPGWVHGLLIFKELLVQLIDEPIVGSKWTIGWSGHGLGPSLLIYRISVSPIWQGLQRA
jgi:hypothetical protein